MTNSQNSSTPSRFLKDITERLAEEHVAYTAREAMPTARRYREVQNDLLTSVKDVGRSGDLSTIMAVEKAILKNELRLYGNSSGMKNSLGAALQELDQAQKHHGIVQDKARYASVDELFQRPRNRRSGLPYDEARQFFRAHKTRLLNQDRSRLSETEKKTINARRSNIRTAEKAYIALQQQALGIAPKKDRGRDRGLSL